MSDDTTAAPDVAPDPAPDPEDAALQRLRQRQQLLRDHVRGVATGLHTGLYVYGRPGTGKTSLVRDTLRCLGITPEYRCGYQTAAALFDLFAQHPDTVIVLDDVAAMLRSEVAAQLLLAALADPADPTAPRSVTYQTRKGKEQATFRGRVIFISNLELPNTPLLAAVHSRVTAHEYSPDDEEVGAMARQIARLGWRHEPHELTPQECGQIVDFVVTEAKRLSYPIDLRTITKAYKDYLQSRMGWAESDWRDLVLSSLHRRACPLAFAPFGGRAARLEANRRAAIQVRLGGGSWGEQVAKWKQETGASESAYARRLREIDPNTAG